MLSVISRFRHEADENCAFLFSLAVPISALDAPSCHIYCLSHQCGSLSSAVVFKNLSAYKSCNQFIIDLSHFYYSLFIPESGVAQFV